MSKSKDGLTKEQRALRKKNKERIVDIIIRANDYPSATCIVAFRNRLEGCGRQYDNAPEVFGVDLTYYMYNADGTGDGKYDEMRLDLDSDDWEFNCVNSDFASIDAHYKLRDDKEARKQKVLAKLSPEDREVLGV